SKKPRKSATTTATPTPTPTPSASPDVSGSVSETGLSPTPSPSVTPKPRPAPNATISDEEIADYENNTAAVKWIIQIALGLTSLNLDYRYGSADPANGGMDCSGFIYFVLSKCSISDV